MPTSHLLLVTPVSQDEVSDADKIIFDLESNMSEISGGDDERSGGSLSEHREELS